MKTLSILLTALVCSTLVRGVDAQEGSTPDYRTVSLWKLDTGSGTVVVDKADLSGKGEIAGNARWVEDDCGKGIEFDGATAKILVEGGGDVTFGVGESFTIDAVVRSRKSGVTQRIWYAGQAGLEVRTDGVVWFNAWNSTAQRTLTVEGKKKITDGACHRVTAVRDVGQGKLSLYVDGELDASTDCPVVAEFPLPGPVVIGGEAAEPTTRKGEYFSGTIYKIHISRGVRLGAGAEEPEANPLAGVTFKPQPTGTLPLTKNGKSAYVIYHDPAAPLSVRQAARELQRALYLSTSVALPIVNAPANPMICLGDNAAARKAGFSAAKFPEEAFRYVTKGANVYIVGKDHAEGQEKWKPHPGYFYFGLCVSRGTLFGTYAFLEDAVGVRWLMPGAWGEDIPDNRAGLYLKPMDRTDAPDVLCRRLYAVQNRRDDVRLWSARNRMGGSICPEASHAFDTHPGVEALQGHPEYMPMRADGTREPIWPGHREGVYDSHKYCLTNPGLAQAFADSVMRRFAATPKMQCESISPSDGQGWCLCPICQGQADRDATGPFGDFDGRKYSYTPILLNFYNQVARSVGQKFPDRLIGGFAYYEGLYPPVKPMQIEPNVFIEIAMNGGYGFKLYQPKRAEEFAKLIPAWAKLTSNLGWTDYTTWMRDAVGAPLPPGLSLMKLVFPALKKKGVKAVSYTGIEAWGYGAAANYLATKLMWDCDANVDQLYHDFLNRAYGPGAPMIDRIYQLVEKSLQEFIRSKPYPDHEVWYDTALEVWQPHIQEMEKLYQEAFAAAKTDAQRKRLEMFGDNLVMLHYNMRKVGMIEKPEASSLYRSDADYGKFIQEKVGSLSVINLAKWAEGQKRYGKVQMALWGPEKRTLAIPQLPEGTAAPKIDGDLSDAVWKSVAVADAFRESGSRDPAIVQTTARITYDSANLYVAVECQEPEPANVKKGCTTRDSGSIFNDDVVEIFLGTNPNNPKGFYHLVINPANAIWDGIYADAKPNLTLTSATGTTANSWTVELAIPFASLNMEPPKAGTTWRCNLARVRQSTPSENSTWCSVEGSFLLFDAFGEWRFGK